MSIIKEFRKVKKLEDVYFVMSSDEIAALDKFIHDKIKEAFEAGDAYRSSFIEDREVTDENGFDGMQEFVLHDPEDRSSPEPNFDEWFKNKYK